MNCKEFREAVPLIPGGELDDNKKTQALNHIQECNECRIECEKYAFLKDLLAGMKNMDDIPFNWEQFSAATVEKAFLKKGKGSGISRWAQFAPYIRAAVLIITAGLFFSAGLFWKSEDTFNYQENGARIRKTEYEEAETYKPSGEPLREIQLWEMPPFLKDDLGNSYSDVSAEGFAPINRNKENTAEGAWLGLHVQDFGKESIIVKDVIQGGPSEKSGIISGDIIYSCNGSRITTINGLRRLLASIPPGQKIKLEIVRKGKKHNITVTSARVPHHL